MQRNGRRRIMQRNIITVRQLPVGPRVPSQRNMCLAQLHGQRGWNRDGQLDRSCLATSGAAKPVWSRWLITRRPRTVRASGREQVLPGPQLGRICHRLAPAYGPGESRKRGKRRVSTARVHGLLLEAKPAEIQTQLATACKIVFHRTKASWARSGPSTSI
jgi:hypothetical protein